MACLAAIWRGASPLIIAVRSKFMNESPLWAANQGDLEGAARILRDSYGISAHAAEAHEREPVKKAPPKVSFRVLFHQPYRERTIVTAVMNICISFEYTAIAFFLPSILAQFLGAGVFETISASLGLNALFAFTGGLLGMRLAWKLPSRHVAIAGFALQFIALILLALIGHPTATPGVVFAILMLGLWLFAEGFGPGAQMMIYPALSYPTHIRATGVGFGRSLSGVGSALALFILPILQAAYGTNMFWIVSLAAIIPIIFLLIIRFEPTRQDIDDQSETGGSHV